MARETIEHTPEVFGFADERSREFPRLILACIAQPCNAQCPHCFLTVELQYFKKHFGQSDEHRFMPWELWKTFVDEMAAERDHTHIRISSYGETMLHPEFMRFIRYARKKGVEISIITNGSLMTEEVSRAMVNIGVQSVEISAETHEKDLYEKIKKGLRFEIMVENIETLVRLRDQARSPMIIMVGIVNQPASNPKIKEAVAYWGQRVDHVSVRHFVTWGLEKLHIRGETTDPYLSVNDPCPFPYERFMLDPSAKIRLCPYDNQGKIPAFGQIGETTIREAWQGERHNNIKACHAHGMFDHEQAKTNAPLCSGCDDRVNRSWTWNYLSIPKKTRPKYRHARDVFWRIKSTVRVAHCSLKMRFSKFFQPKKRK